MDKAGEMWLLMDLEKELKYMEYDKLELKYLEPLRAEVARHIEFLKKGGC